MSAPLLKTLGAALIASALMFVSGMTRAQDTGVCLEDICIGKPLPSMKGRQLVEVRPFSGIPGRVHTREFVNNRGNGPAQFDSLLKYGPVCEPIFANVFLKIAEGDRAIVSVRSNPDASGVVYIVNAFTRVVEGTFDYAQRLNILRQLATRYKLQVGRKVVQVDENLARQSFHTFKIEGVNPIEVRVVFDAKYTKVAFELIDGLSYLKTSDEDPKYLAYLQAHQMQAGCSGKTTVPRF